MDLQQSSETGELSIEISRDLAQGPSGLTLDSDAFSEVG
jgi:hypothetical protein